MRRIKLSNSEERILCDDEDFERVRRHSWRLNNSYSSIFATIDGCIISLASFIMGDLRETFDHKDLNIYNNQRSNLRICTFSQNMANRSKPKNGVTSKFKGVSWFERDSIWRVNIRHTYLGRFKSEGVAARVYDREARKLFGEFARLNFPKDGEQGI